MRLLFLIGLCLWLLYPSANAQLKKLTVDHYLDYETVNAPQISPSGTEIIYTRTWIDKVNDSRVNDLWIMDADGGRQRLFVAKAGSPRWSPDGKAVAYLAEGHPKGSQIYVKLIGTEGSTPVTHIDRSPSNLSWSPDGKWLAFTMLVPMKKSWPIAMPKRPEGAKWIDEPRVIERYRYRLDRVGFLEEGYSHIFVVPATGGTPRQVTQGEWNVEEAFAWSANSREIIYSANQSPDADREWWYETNLYAIGVAPGSQQRQLTSVKGIEDSPVVSPDGKLIAYNALDQGDDTWKDSRVWVMNADGTNPRMLTDKLDRSPLNMTWSADGTTIYFTVQDQGTENIYSVSATSGAYRQVTRETRMLTLSTLSKTGVAVGTASGPQSPVEIYRLDVATPASLRLLTAVNADILEGVTLGKVEEVRYKSTDDLEIQGWTITPPDFDPAKKYPLILVIHGGPHAMYNVAFNFTWQLHAAEGYVVLYTNPRGSTGYGSAFGNAIKYDYPSKDYDDLMKGVDAVVAKGFIDEKNLFVYGGSGGGVLTAWTVGHTERFAAAASNFPVINWMSFFGTSDIARWTTRWFRRPLWEDPSEHLRHSPLMHVQKVKTPVMLMTGVQDLRTPISQTEEYYQALKELKVPTAMVRFNNEYHGTSSVPSNFCRSVGYLHHWFGKYKR